MSLKPDLTVEEVLKIGYLHHIMGVEQHALSIAFTVNSGRVSEAAQVMRYAAENYRQVYKELQADEATNGKEEKNASAA